MEGPERPHADHQSARLSLSRDGYRRDSIRSRLFQIRNKLALAPGRC